MAEEWLSDQKRLRKSLMSLMNNTGYLAVVNVISIIESVHLSGIARFIGKSKSTTLHTIEKLMTEEPAIIEIDTEKTLNTKGVRKFYRLTGLGLAVMRYQDQMVKDRQILPDPDADIHNPSSSRLEYATMIEEEAKNRLLEFGESGLTNLLTMGCVINKHIQTAAAMQFVELGKKILDGKEIDQKKIPIGAFFSDLTKIRVVSFDQILRLQRLIASFYQDLTHLEEEFNSEIDHQLAQGKLDQGMVNEEYIYLGLSPSLIDL